MGRSGATSRREQIPMAIHRPFLFGSASAFAIHVYRDLAVTSASVLFVRQLSPSTLILTTCCVGLSSLPAPQRLPQLVIGSRLQHRLTLSTMTLEPPAFPTRSHLSMTSTSRARRFPFPALLHPVRRPSPALPSPRQLTTVCRAPRPIPLCVLTTPSWTKSFLRQNSPLGSAFSP